MGDRWVVLLAACVTLGAWWAGPVPWWAGAAGVALALAWRRPLLLCLAAAVLAAGLAHRSWSAVSPLSPGPVAARVTLVDDPAPAFGAIRATARLGSARVELWARGGAAGQLRARLAGEQVDVRGRLEPMEPAAAERLARRHVRGRLVVDAVTGTGPAAPAYRAANHLRRTLEHGARVLPPVERSLLLGFVLGDDRAQPEEVREAFRAAGLAHLTTVSGQNVAFALVVAGPALRRLGLRGRWVATVGTIAWFALLTRFEPSVLRASAMAALAATTVLLDRPASGVRLLGLAVAGLLVVDPFLVWSVGWWLSVAATAGIVLLAGPLAAHLPGPRPVALAVSVTLAAQLGVAPVQLAVFGPLPVAALPANLLAGPVAGPVMVWGLPAGLAAGLLPEPLATALHLPTLLMVRWIALVARVGQAAPLGSVSWPVAAALLVGAGLLAWRARRAPPDAPDAPGPHASRF